MVKVPYPDHIIDKSSGKWSDPCYRHTPWRGRGVLLHLTKIIQGTTLGQGRGHPYV